MFKKKTQVILDTNILLLPGQLGVDIFEELKRAIDEPYTLCTYEGVMEELQKLMKKKTKDGFNAKLGFIMAKQKDLKILKGSKSMHIDDCIVQHAEKSQIIVTQDKELIERLQVRVLRFQQKKFVFQRG